MIDFIKKTAIVTGGTRGIGKAIVSLLVEHGSQVIYTGTAPECEEEFPRARYEPLDLGSRSSLTRFESEVVSPLSHLDILINNAGINIIEPIYQIDDRNWDKIIMVNLSGAMRMMRCCVKKMMEAGKGGKILNVSSIFGVVSKEKRNAYTASKTGLIGLTRASALDLAREGILVNALCPGFTNTELTASILSEQEMRRLAQDVPVGRFAEVGEIAKTAVFLCSDMNSYMTGQTIVIDGGFTAQ
ncbi:MAG: SDR family oxidoreductase [Desulfobacteraceae bacterium]|nr:SDR family oxidoreductase [Desulfobacteraceae bacterium]